MLDLERVGSCHLDGGDLHEEEISTVLRKFGLRREAISKFFDLISADEDGCITFSEFKAAMKECNKELEIRLVERVFLVFEDPASCLLAKIVSLFTTALIFISTTAFVVESLPQFRAQDEECDGISVSCLPTMSKEATIGFMAVETFCVVGFTIDYVARLLCCPFVRSYVIGHASRGESHPVFHYSADVHGERKKEALQRHVSDDWPPLRLLRFLLLPMNVVDFIAIFPFYLEMFIPSDGGDDGLLVLRLLRLGRVLRLLRLSKRNAGMIIFANAFTTAFGVLGVLMFMIVLITILFGTLAHLTEGGDWYEPSDDCNGFQCSELYPKGAYLRPDKLGDNLEESPYKSIVHSCWAVMTTITTVGYGDVYPTTPWGKLVASVSMIVGLLVVALPITVLGGAFAHEVQKHGAHLDQTQQRQKVHYKEFLLRQLEQCHQGSTRHMQLTRKLQMIQRYEKEVHIASRGDESSAVPGGGDDEFVLLTLARIHKDLTSAIEKVHARLDTMSGVAGKPASPAKRAERGRQVVESTPYKKLIM
jgi:hypothetical protein